MYRNLEYVKKRDRLIKVAEKNTKALLGDLPDPEEWDRTFINEMDRLAVDAGIQDVRYHAPMGGL
jgi:hypothetical protein